MNDWTLINLGDGLNVKHGYAFKGEHFSDHGDYVVLTPGNFWEHGGFKVSRRPKFYSAEFPERYLLTKGDVVVAMTEQSPGLLGSSATIPSDGIFLHNQRLGLLEITTPRVLDLRFVYHLMNSSDVRGQIEATATGSKVRHTAPERILAVKALVPSTDVQRTIAEVLDTLDDLIDNNRRRVELLEQMAEAIYREWFVHFRYPGHEAVPMVDSPLGPIPEGWKVRPFSAIARFMNGFAFKPSHWGAFGRPIIKIRELKQGVTGDTPRCDQSQVDTKYWVEPGDLLFSWSADLGVYRWSNEPGLLNQHLFKVTSADDLSLAFLQQALHQAVDKFWHRAQGTTMRHIKRSALSEVFTVVPPRHVESRFADLTEPIIREAMVLHKSNRWLVAIRDLLLPKLVTGQIDVSDLDLDALVGSAT
ncbi:MAG: restriction endonuclease subunit S [Dehalococcoidia bacterium]